MFSESKIFKNGVEIIDDERTTKLMARSWLLSLCEQFLNKWSSSSQYKYKSFFRRCFRLWIFSTSIKKCRESMITTKRFIKLWWWSSFDTLLTELTVKLNVNEAVRIEDVENLDFSLKIEIEAHLSKSVLLSERNLLSMRWQCKISCFRDMFDWIIKAFLIS